MIDSAETTASLDQSSIDRDQDGAKKEALRTLKMTTLNMSQLSIEEGLDDGEENSDVVSVDGDFQDEEKQENSEVE